MGGVAMSPSGKGGRKSLDAAINLVPFIDLLSCCLSFLLITAVWTQLASVPVTHASPGRGEHSDTPPEMSLMLFIGPEGFLLTRSTGETLQLNRKSERLDLSGLEAAMRRVKQEYPDKGDITVRSTDGISYDELIKTIDTLRAAQFPQVQVSEATGT